MQGQKEDVYQGNLLANGQNRRLRVGAVMLTIALGGAVLLVQADIARAWRLALFVPFTLASFGAWQGLYRVCPGMAAKGCREGAHGEDERIMRPEEASLAKKTGQRVMVGALSTAMMATALVLFIR